MIARKLGAALALLCLGLAPADSEAAPPRPTDRSAELREVEAQAPPEEEPPPLLDDLTPIDDGDDDVPLHPHPNTPREATAVELHEPTSVKPTPEIPKKPTFVRPDDKPPVTLTPSAHYYLRSQGRYNAENDPAVGDREHHVYQRVRLGLLATMGPLRAFVQVHDVRRWGFEEATIANQANVDLHQGYLELGRKRSQRSGFVRVGRQEIQVGSRRLIADRNWHPVGQSFDALRLYGAIGRFGADVGVMVLGHARAFTIDDPSGDPDLATPVASPGSYAGYVELFAHLSRAIKLEALAIGLFERPTPWAPTTERNIINAGMRFFGEPLPGLTYDVETYAQGGTNLGLRHRAWALLSDVGYTFKHSLRPGGHLRYHHASGQACTGTPDEGCGNTSSTEFHRLFGLRHAFYGIVDRVAHSNLREIEVATKIRPHESVKLNLSYHFLQLDQPTGLWKNAPDQQVGSGWDPTNTDRNLGHEIDFIVNYRPYQPLMVQPGYGVFFPREAARRLTGPAPQHFIYLWLIANF